MTQPAERTTNRPSRLARRRAAVSVAAMGAALGLFLAAGASADEMRPNAAGVRIGPEGFDFVKALLPGLLPTHIDVPPIDKDVYDCPAGKKITAHVTRASADLHLNSLDAGLVSEAVDVDVNLDVRGRGHLRVTNAYVCFGELECDIGFGLNALNLKAKLGIGADAGNVSVSLQDVLMNLTPDDLDLDVSGCAVDGLVEGFVDLAKGLLFDYAKSFLSGMIEEKVPPLVQEKLQGILGKEGSLLGFDYKLALGDVNVSPEGLDAYLSLGINYSGPKATCLPADAVDEPAPSRGELAMGQGPRSPFALGISGAFLDDALRAVWRSGLLCIDDSKLEALGLDLSQFDLAHVVPGLPPGTELHFQLVTAQPPMVAGGSDGTISLSLGGAALELRVAAPGVPESTITVGTDVTLTAKAGVDAVTGMIGLAVTDLRIERLEISSGQDTAAHFALEPGKIEQLVQEIVLPLIAAKVGTVPIAPSAFGLAGYYVKLDEVVARPEGFYVGVSAFKAPSSDDKTPLTEILGNPSAITRPGLVRFLVGGNDDKTPTDLLRYSWQLDDGPVSEPSFARDIRVPVTTDGDHTFRVVAVDLNDNVDPEPQAFSFTLDSISPILQLTKVPPPIVETTSLKIGVTGSDDRTPASMLRFSYRVEETKPGGKPEVIQNTMPGPLAGDIPLDNLNDGSVYNVTVLVQDEAGNITSQSASFAVHGGAGCSVSAGTPVSGSQGFVVLALLGLVGLALRRRP